MVDQTQDSQREDSSNPIPSNASDLNQKAKNIDKIYEISPIQEITSKLEQRAMMSKEEIQVITSCMTTNFNDNIKQFSTPDKTVRVKEYLWIVYYTILNTHLFSKSRNYLEQQALQKLIKETLNLIKDLLIILTPKKKDQENVPLSNIAVLYNSILPPVFKILSLFASTNKQQYEEQHYKYLRARFIKIENLNLSYLNQILTQLAPQLYEPSSKQSNINKTKDSGQEEFINLDSSGLKPIYEGVKPDQDFINSMLEFVPSGYDIVAKSLQEQIKASNQVQDETMSQVEEEKEPEKIEELEIVIRDHIQKSKIIETLGQALDRLVNLSQENLPAEFFLLIDTRIFSILSKNLDKIASLKPKTVAPLMQKGILEKAMKSQNAVIDHFSKLKDIDRLMQMDIDTIVDTAQGTKVEKKALLEQIQVLAKCFEIFSQQKNSSALSEIIKEAHNFKYLSKFLMNDQEKHLYTNLIECITSSACEHLKQTQLQNEPTLDLLTTLTRLVIVSRSLSQLKQKSDGTKQQDKSQPSANAQQQAKQQTNTSEQSKQQTSSVRTRRQAKKDQTETNTTQQQQRESAQQAKPNLSKDFVPLIEFLQVDAFALLKTSISILTQQVPRFFKTRNLVLSGELIKNIFSLAANNQSLITRLIYGLLTDFTRPSVTYQDQSLQLLTAHILKKLPKILQSHNQTIFTLRWLFFLSSTAKNADLPQSIAIELLQSEKRNQQASQKNPASYRRQLIFLSCILVIQNQSTRLQLLKTCLQNNGNLESLPMTLHQIQVILLNQETIAKFQPSIMKLIQSIVTDQDGDQVANGIDIEVEKLMVTVLIKEGIFVKELLIECEKEIGIELIVGKLVAEGKRGKENKKYVSNIMETVIKILREAKNESIVQKARHEYENYLGEQMSKGASNIELINSKYEIDMIQDCQILQQRLKTLDPLREEDWNFVYSIIRSLQYIGSQIEDASLSMLREHFKDQTQGDQIASLLLDSVKGIMYSQKQRTLYQQLFEHSSLSSSELLSLLLDPQQLSKHLQQLRSNSLKLEDHIYSHCLSSQSPKDQPLTSNLLLFKSLFLNLAQIVHCLPIDDKSRDIALTLIRMKGECPYVEYLEGGSQSFDFDMNDKLLSRTINKEQQIIANREYINMRSFDSVLRIMKKAENIQNNKINQIMNEHAQAIQAASFTSSQSDTKLIQAYFQLEQNQLSEFFKQTFQCISLRDIWLLMFKYIEIDATSEVQEQVQVNKESKGGLQLTINFAPEQPNKKGGRARQSGKFSANKSTQDNNAADKNVQEESKKEEEGEKKSRQISFIGQKLFSFISDIISVNQSSSKDLISLSIAFKKAFLDTGDAGLNMIKIIIDTQQIRSLRKFIASLVTNPPGDFIPAQESSSLKQGLQSLILNMLKNCLSLPTQFVMLFDIYSLISDSNQDLQNFILTYLLPNTKGSAKLNFYLLDQLCQLSQSKFSSIENDQVKYSKEQIRERRVKMQEQRRKIVEDRKNELSQQIEIQENQNPNDIVEGYKCDKLQKESESAKYMERPEDVCTYAYTKKEFKMQHWYYCYTCRLTENSGCCAVCANKCHKGHNIVYSKKSNFFCDCGDSGRCICLNPGKPGVQDQISKPSSSKRPRPEQPQLQDRGMLFSEFRARPPERALGGPPMGIGFGGPPGDYSLFSDPFLQGNQAHIPPPRLYRGPGENPFIQHDEMLRNLGSGVPASILQHLNPKFLSESSEGDELLHRGMPNPLQFIRDADNDEDDDDDDDDDIERDHPLWGSAKHVMNIVKKVPQRIHQQAISARGGRSIFSGHHFGGHPFGGMDQKIPSKKLIEIHSQSNISNINPLEDPFSDAGAQTPLDNQNIFRESFDNMQSNQEDVEMKQVDEIELMTALVNNLKQQHTQFTEVFNMLLQQIDQQLSQSTEQMQLDSQIDSSLAPVTFSPSKQKQILSSKQSVILVQDLTQNKKVFKENAFQFRVQNDVAKNTLQQNINLLNTLDSNRDGLVAVCEDQEVNFYAGSQFFEEGSLNSSEYEQFNFASKENQQLSKLDGQKFTYQPLQLKFNPSQPYYAAVVGAQNVDVLVLTKQGKINYKVSVDLLLEAISKDLTIVNVNWLPGSQSTLAIATRDFIKIYDLSEDTISPTHNIMIFNGFISDFTFSSHQVLERDASKAITKIYASSKAGAVYHMDINYNLNNSFEINKNQGEEKMKIDSENSDLMLTEALIFDPAFNIQENKTQCLSIYCAQNFQDLLLISISGGHTIIGRQEKNSDIFNGFKLSVQDDPTFNSSPNKTIWQKYGETLVNFKEIEQCSKNNETKLYLSAMSRKMGQNFNQSGIPLIMEISDTKVQVNITKSPLFGNSSINPVIGQAYVKKSVKGSGHMRFVNIMSDGSCSTYVIKTSSQADQEEEKSGQNIDQNQRNVFGNLDMLLSRSDLPKEVKLSINFFEKTKNIFADPNLRQKITIAGDFIGQFKTSKATLEALCKQTNSVMYQESSKKSVKFSLKFDNSSDHVITGLRIKLDYGQNKNQQSHLSLKLFNRVLNLKNYHQNGQVPQVLFEIPFCDAEVIFGSFSHNNMAMEFLTEDPKQCPIRICELNIFGLTKKEFGFKEKVKKLEKLNFEKLSKMISATNSNQQNNEKSFESIQEELLQTKGIPFVTINEKMKFFSSKVDANQLQLIQTLDIITQYLSVTKTFDQQQFIHLIENLKKILHVNIDGNEFVIASIKRCLRKLLNIISPNAPLGDAYNYQTIKDINFVQTVMSRVSHPELSLSEVRKYFRIMMNIYSKRCYQLFKIIQNPQLIQTLVKQYVRLYKSQNDTKETSQDVSDILGLTMAVYHQRINQNECQVLNQSSSIEEAIHKVYQEKSLAQVFDILQPLIAHNDDLIQKLTVSNILTLTDSYSQTMAKSIKTQSLPSTLYSVDGLEKKLSILVVDFTPHLLNYVLSLLDNPSVLSTSELSYQLAYKLAKIFDSNNHEQYQSAFTQYLIEPLVTFMKSTLVQTTSDRFQKNEKYLYVNLVLFNTFMQQALKDTHIKIKGSKLGLDAKTQSAILSNINNDKEFIQRFIQWETNIVQTYANAFKAQKCSYRTKIDDGIPGEVYEVIDVNVGGHGQKNLLRPVIESSTWKWHPLFLKGESQFELIDRKIPVQIMLLNQFVLSQCQVVDQIERETGETMHLVRAIRELVFKKPSKAFLKQIGEQSIRSILKLINPKDEQGQKEVERVLTIVLKGSAAFEEFAEVYEILYCKSLSKKGVALTYNLQFQLHSLLSSTWKKALKSPESWSSFIHSSSSNLLLQLFNSCFLLSDDSALPCLQLCALSYDPSIVISFKSSNENTNISLFSLFAQKQNKLSQLSSSYSIDIPKLIDVMLLGRNKKQLRIAAAHLIKGIYERENTRRELIKETMLQKITTIRSNGVNSTEFMALLSVIVNIDIEGRGSVDTDFYSRFTKEIYREVQRTNQQLTGHENLEVYATLQKLTNAFTQSQPEIQIGEDEDFLKKLLILEKEAGMQLNERAILRGGLKITNPYLLESEACQKCYAQRSLPFSQMRLNDIKTEAKFTDSQMIYRFNSTYLLKQIQITQDGFRGNKVIKEIQVFVNNKQGIDLADMRNNYSHWRKVKTHYVEVGQRQIVIQFTLPVNATNLLLEYTTQNVGKIMNKEKGGYQKTQIKGKEKEAKIESIHQVKGLDSVLMTLPKNIAAKLGIVHSEDKNEGRDESGSIIDKDQVACPRCGKLVQGKHGICNQCGENALQCTYCRNINYEKPDGFLCNECGNSRFVKLDIGFTVKHSFATEKIETEEAKAQAMHQIEQNLQSAQSAYSSLMKKRQFIDTLMRKINEGMSEGGKLMADTFTEECADFYQKMMKSLNTIKILKIEIDQYTMGAQPDSSSTSTETQSSALTRSNSALSSKEDQAVQSHCFSCIQEYLKGLLSFIHITSDSLSSQYKSQGFLELLYKENIRMYTASLQEPARKAICYLLKGDQEQSSQLLSTIQNDLFLKKHSIPAHLLASNIIQETYLVLDQLKLQYSLKQKNDAGSYYPLVSQFMWQILFQALNEGQNNAAIADQVAGAFISFIKESIKSTQNESLKNEMQELITSMFDSTKKLPQYFESGLNKYLNGQNFIMTALTIGSSQRVRNEAKEIITQLVSQNKQLHTQILRQLLQIIDKVLTLESSSGDQYFDLLVLILNPQNIKENITEDSLRKSSQNHIYIEAFDTLFKLIDQELNKLLKQETSRQTLGADGFMPQISTGQIFARIVSLVSSMIKESSHLKGIIQRNVSIVIKSFLKIRKLNLTKNKVIQTSENEIEKMFKELHSQREEERENFILECIKFIESGECDNQEMRFLFEEICKVIDPVKPEPEYLLNLTKAQSQEFYFRGKMSKNPYLSSQLGKTMEDVRLKICKEMELAEPELVELLVANKIVAINLSIKDVYEQVHWPALCKQRNPDIYDIPPIEEAPKNSLNPMTVVYRLMGIDGEATEDRVETLQDGSEADMDPANIMKKYGITQTFCKPFESKRKPQQMTTGVQVLLEVLESFGSLSQQRYLAEWLFKLMGFVLKIKNNRAEFMKYKKTVDHLAKRLFESVGMQSQIEGKKGMTLFDVILIILEPIISEVNSNIETLNNSSLQQYEGMQIDMQENAESATHIEIFISIMNDACNEMIESHHGLEKTSTKIKAVSKILPFLINREDMQAQQIIIDFIAESLTKIPLLDNPAKMNAKEKFTSQFNIERVIEILESTPPTKNYLKDKIIENCGQLLQSMWNYLMSTTLVDLSQESQVFKHKLANTYTLKIILNLLKNHPLSQQSLYQSNRSLIDKLYELTQSKYKEKVLTILAQDVVESLTNKNYTNDALVSEHLQKLIDQQNEEKRKLALKKKQEIMRQMAMKKNTNKFIQQIENVSLQEETGPKCIVCQEGYTKRPTEVLGMYVFSKKLKISEMSHSGNGFTNTIGYTTVTHSNFIHFSCHQNAYRVDSQLRQPKKEWEGAAIRNDHTKCNNLLPIRGGTLPLDSYAQMVDRYFQIQVKSAGQCDHDRVKVMQHDFKLLMKRLAYEDSFSRDTHGGGPEHNMHLVPFMLQMITYLLTAGGGYSNYCPSSDQSKFTFLMEKRLFEFLEQGIKQKKDFLQKLEEEKRSDEIEEEEKYSQSQDDGEDSKMMDEEDGEDNTQMNNFSLDQIAYMLSLCVVYCQMPRWEQYKHKFLTIILCTVANMKEDKSAESQPKPIGQQTDFATGKRILTIAKGESDTQMVIVSESDAFSGLGSGGEVRKRRISSDNRNEVINRALFRLRPLLVLMKLVDAIKQRWDAKRLGLIGESSMKHEDYLKKLMSDFLAKGNLSEVISECDELFREYKDRILRLSSVEEFLQELGMLDHINQQQNLEQFILSHFQM